MKWHRSLRFRLGIIMLCHSTAKNNSCFLHNMAVPLQHVTGLPFLSQKDKNLQIYFRLGLQTALLEVLSKVGFFSKSIIFQECPKVFYSFQIYSNLPMLSIYSWKNDTLDFSITYCGKSAKKLVLLIICYNSYKQSFPHQFPYFPIFSCQLNQT